MPQTVSFDPVLKDILARETYEGFREALAGSGCPRCGLAGSRTKIVVDRGTPGTGILVIGEAPGKNEDEQGRAFVGMAGRTFDQAMASVGLDTDRDMLICNVVKCRPPDNRPPRADEALACRPYLMRQIGLAGPKAILLLGATALKHLDPARKKFSMQAEAGKFFKLDAFPDCWFMVFYHPAALLYNRKLKPAMWEHAKKLKEFLDRGCRP